MRARSSWLVAMTLLVACAHRPATHVAAPAPPPPRPRLKLAVLPVDEDQFPVVAKSINRAFADVKVAGIDDYFLSKVTLEVVQLSIECVQPTSACYAAAGKSLGANKLLLGQVVGVGKRKRDKAVRVTVTLFDVDSSEAVNVVDHVYKTPEAAAGGVSDLVAEATGEPPKPYGPEPESPSSTKAAPGSSVARGGGRP
jgi:hypothetical protein